MPEQELEQIYSDEVQEILGHIPNWIIRWGIAVITITVLVLLGSSWFVKYPEVISGPITITSQIPPVDVVTRSMGRLKLLVDDGDLVDEMEILGYIESSSSFDDVMTMEKTINQVSLNADEKLLSTQLMQVRKLRNLSLGEVQGAFENLQNHIQSLLLFYELDVHSQQIKHFRGKIISHEELNRKLNDQKKLISNELEVGKTIFLSDSTLWLREHISERDFDQSRLNLIQRQRSFEDADIAILNNLVLIKDYESRIDELSFEQQQQHEELLTGLEEALKVLKSQVSGWKQSYLLQSPFQGTAVFIEYLTDNQFIQSGEPLMTVIPDHPEMFGIVHIPVNGSGRVNIKQRINISLENYPPEEYGRILGVVEHVSPIPRENTYSIRVSLPEGLKTSYGQTLNFRQQMQGMADIITEDLRLLERVFYQFRNLIDQAV